MCRPVPDSCSEHEVTRYEHHLTSQNIHLPSCNPLSQSILMLDRNLLQPKFFSVSPTLLLIDIEQRHTQGTTPMLCRKLAVCPNTRAAGESAVGCAGRAIHGCIYPTVPGIKSQCPEGMGAIQPLPRAGVVVMTQDGRGS